MAAESLLVRQGVASGVPVAVIRLVDRRPNADVEPQEWAFQREVEAALLVRQWGAGQVGCRGG